MLRCSACSGAVDCQCRRFRIRIHCVASLADQLAAHIVVPPLVVTVRFVQRCLVRARIYHALDIAKGSEAADRYYAE